VVTDDLGIHFVYRVFEYLFNDESNPESVDLCHEVTEALESSCKLANSGFSSNRSDVLVNLVERQTQVAHKNQLDKVVKTVESLKG